jgi:hypothetical protein
MRPMLAASRNGAIPAGGKTAAVKPGIRPMAEGPKMMPCGGQQTPISETEPNSP